jgi:wobble nucleotide-excising tRNase
LKEIKDLSEWKDICVHKSIISNIVEAAQFTFSVISIKISPAFRVEVDKLTMKYTSNGAQNKKNNLEKEKQNRNTEIFKI